MAEDAEDPGEERHSPAVDLRELVAEIANAADVRHAREAEVRRLGDEGSQEGAFVGRRQPGRDVPEPRDEPGPALDLGEDIGDARCGYDAVGAGREVGDVALGQISALGALRILGKAQLVAREQHRVAARQSTRDVEKRGVEPGGPHVEPGLDRRHRGA